MWGAVVSALFFAIWAACWLWIARTLKGRGYGGFHRHCVAGSGSWLSALVFLVVAVSVGPEIEPSATSADGQEDHPPEKTAEEKAEEKAKEKAACREDLQCWGEEHMFMAGSYCQPLIEDRAKYSAKWTDSWAEPKISHFRWRDKEDGLVTFIGDKVQFQNGYGAWQPMTYECDYDPSAEQVRAVRLHEGRL